MKVFFTERSIVDSERYIQKIKQCQNPVLKAPTNTKKVDFEFRFEMSRIRMYFTMSKFNQKKRKLLEKLKEKFGKKNN